ncbi:hypothetical protein ACWEN6_13880 [Sphaerisporangium sp. NPDC004334]
MTRFGTVEEVRGLAEPIAAALGDGFHLVQEPAIGKRPPAVLLVSGDRRLMVHFATLRDAALHNRLTITGLDPTQDSLHGWRTGPQIRVTADRPATDLAKDITRRLMPLYTAHLARQMERIAQAQIKKALLTAEAQRIAALLPAGRLEPAEGVVRDAPRIEFGDRGDITISADHDGRMRHWVSVGLHPDDPLFADLLDLINRRYAKEGNHS